MSPTAPSGVSAQRLSASRRRKQADLVRIALVADVLNAFRHRGEGNPGRAACRDRRRGVLNAFRHRGEGNTARQPCSRPRARCVLNAFRHRGEGNKRQRSSSTRRVSDGVLNAFRHRGEGNPYSEHTAASPMGAQRLSASRRRKHHHWLRARCLDSDVLNAFRHRGEGNHLPISTRTHRDPACSTPFGIEAKETSTPYSSPSAAGGAQRLSASRRRKLRRVARSQRV